MRELVTFFIILIVLSLAQHPDFLTAPIDRIIKLPTAGAYGIGAIHPLVFTIFAYLVFILFRAIGRRVKKLFIK
ncbi:MAG TPA: hypothetical protein EYG69_00930 [Campylobacterales bacterium]|nr:hypothetical protein [Campylobacterales bacterium]